MVKSTGNRRASRGSAAKEAVAPQQTKGTKKQSVAQRAKATGAWTEAEVAALRAGVEKYGSGKWQKIIDDKEFKTALKGRDSTALRLKVKAGLPAAPTPKSPPSKKKATPKKEAPKAKTPVSKVKSPPSVASPRTTRSAAKATKPVASPKPTSPKPTSPLRPPPTFSPPPPEKKRGCVVM